MHFLTIPKNGTKFTLQKLKFKKCAVTFVVQWGVDCTVRSLESTLCDSMCGEYYSLRYDAVWTGAGNQRFEGKGPHFRNEGAL
jgi:hypothetical protein